MIADPMAADMTKGTGAVKLTPAHDKNDFAAGLRNDLRMDRQVISEDGTINMPGTQFHVGFYLQVHAKARSISALFFRVFQGSLPAGRSSKPLKNLGSSEEASPIPCK